MIKLLVLCVITFKIDLIQSVTTPLKPILLTRPTTPLGVTVTQKDDNSHDVNEPNDVTNPKTEATRSEDDITSSKADKIDINPELPAKGELKSFDLTLKDDEVSSKLATDSSKADVGSKIDVTDSKVKETVKHEGNVQNSDDRLKNYKNQSDHNVVKKDKDTDSSVKSDSKDNDRLITVKPILTSPHPFPSATIGPELRNKSSKLIKLLNKIDEKRIVQQIVQRVEKAVSRRRSRKKGVEGRRRKKEDARRFRKEPQFEFVLQPDSDRARDISLINKLWDYYKTEKRNSEAKLNSRRPKSALKKAPLVFLLQPDFNNAEEESMEGRDGRRRRKKHVSTSSQSSDDSDSDLDQAEFRRFGEVISNPEVLKTYISRRRRNSRRRKKHVSTSSQSSDSDSSELDRNEFRRSGKRSLTPTRSAIEENIYELFNQKVEENMRRNQNLRRSSHHKKKKKKRKKKKKGKRSHKRHSRPKMRAGEKFMELSSSVDNSSDDSDKDYDFDNWNIRRANPRVHHYHREMDRRSNSYEQREPILKLNYDEKSDDYIITTKKNVWDYEHENWVNTRKVDWAVMHSSGESNIKEKNNGFHSDVEKSAVREKENLERDLLLKEIEQEHKQLSIDKHRGYRGPDVQSNVKSKVRNKKVGRSENNYAWTLENNRYDKEDIEKQVYNDGRQVKIQRDVDDEIQAHDDILHTPKSKPIIHHVREYKGPNEKPSVSAKIPNEYFQKDQVYERNDPQKGQSNRLESWMAIKNANFKDDDEKDINDAPNKQSYRLLHEVPSEIRLKKQELLSAERQSKGGDIDRERNHKKDRESEEVTRSLKQVTIPSEESGHPSKHERDFKKSAETQHMSEERPSPKLNNVLSQSIRWVEGKRDPRLDYKEKVVSAKERDEIPKINDYKGKDLSRDLDRDQEGYQEQNQEIKKHQIKQQEIEQDSNREIYEGKDQKEDWGRNQDREREIDQRNEWQRNQERNREKDLGRNQERDQGKSQEVKQESDQERDKERDPDRDRENSMEGKQDRGRERYQKRDRERNLEKDQVRDQERNQERDEERDQGRSQERYQERDQDRSKERERDRNLESDRDRNQERYQDTNQEKEQDRNKKRDQDKNQERDQDRHQETDQGRNQDRDPERDQDRNRERDQDRNQARDQERNQERDQERNQERDQERNQEKYEDTNQGRFEDMDYDKYQVKDKQSDQETNQEKGQDSESMPAKKKKNVWDRHSNNNWDKVGVDSYMKKTSQLPSKRPVKSQGWKEDSWSNSNRDNKKWSKEEKPVTESQWNRKSTNEWDSVGKIRTEKTWNKHENNNWARIGNMEDDNIAHKKKPQSVRNEHPAFGFTPIPSKSKQSIFEDE